MKDAGVNGSNVRKIILFDGVCDLCNGFVQFLIMRDPEGKFKFGALQSPEAQELLKDVAIDPADLDMVVWSLFALKLVIPPPVRDLVYRMLAKRRYSLFGRKDQCMVPTPELRGRFIHG